MTLDNAPALDHLQHEDHPCLQIQADLSAMLDGELDAASVRRVMVHSDACAACRGFLDGIRTQAQAHRTLAELDRAEPGSPAAALRRQLMRNRQQLARILYELGRGFALMGLSADFSKEVAREPVPVPDMLMRGRSVLDEVERLVRTHGEVVQGEWVAARELFVGGNVRSAAENLANGERLLAECLQLAPDQHECRVYLGLIHHVRGAAGEARSQFAHVLAATQDPVLRAYALLNLGNVLIDEGDASGAVVLLRELVDSGVVREQPRFAMAYFNLALATGLLGRFDECSHWLQRMHMEFPHKRSAVAREIARRPQFCALLREHPEQAGRLARELPGWFAVNAAEAR